MRETQIEVQVEVSDDIEIHSIKLTVHGKSGQVKAQSVFASYVEA